MLIYRYDSGNGLEILLEGHLQFAVGGALHSDGYAPFRIVEGKILKTAPGAVPQVGYILIAGWL